MFCTRRAAESEVPLPQAGVGDAAGPSQNMNRRLLSEIMQSAYSRDDGRERCGDFGIRCVRIVLLPVYKIGMNGSVKGFFHLARGAAELDGHGARSHVVHAKTARRKPSRQLFEIAFGSAKS